jgi:hypothetical protein
MVDNGFPMTMDNMPLRWHFLDFLKKNKGNALRHWIEHVKNSRTALFGFGKDVRSIFYCKIIMDVPKITKMDAFFLFQSKTSIFHDEETSCASFPGAKKARMMQQHSPNSILTIKTKKTTDKQTKNQTHWYAKSQNSKIQF